jgi:hypothetical protein
MERNVESGRIPQKPEAGGNATLSKILRRVVDNEGRKSGQGK